MAKKPKQKLTSVVKNNLLMLGKIAKHTPSYFVLMILEGVIWGFIHSVVSLFNFKLLNAIDSTADFLYAAKIIAVMAGFYILAYAFDRWYWVIKNPLLRRKLHLSMHEELFRKALSLDLACFDDPEFYNDFVWAMNESDRRATEVIEDTGKLINRLVSSATLFGLLLSIDYVIAIMIFSCAAITAVCSHIGNRVSFNHSKETNSLWRKKSYINRVYHLSDYAKELRTHRADELLMREYDENTEQIVKSDKKYGIKYFLLYGLGWNTIGHITFFAVIVYTVILLGRGDIMVGGFAASVSVVFNLRWLLVDLVERITKYGKHSLYIEKYNQFMHFEPAVVGEITDIPEFESLEFRGVSFSYEFSSHPKYKFHDENYTPPKTEGAKEALKNINLKIGAREKIAIVGYNGAGKTTLIKLIMRLYDPTEGEILYNGINIKKFEPSAYRKKIGTVFQDFKIFATSIAENVMNGAYSESDADTVIDALRTTDFTEKLEKLDAGINTHLTREFNDSGTNLSGGEAQKIAIARAFSRDYPIVIMDEPSSALDPLAEYKLNQSILHSTDGKTVIFISHRLSTTRIADKIYMFDTGSLVEEGSHTELLSKNGKYAEMFRVQSEKYQLV